MVSFRLLHNLQVDSAKFPLRWMLVLPFVLLTTGTTALVGYLSYEAGQQAVQDLANQLLQQTSGRISDRLTNYLLTPQENVAANRLAVDRKTLDLNDSEALQEQLWQQILLNPSLSGIGFWSEEGSAASYIRINSEEVRKLAEQVSGQSIPQNTIIFNTVQPNQRGYFWIDSQGKPGQQAYQHNDDFRSVPWYRQAKSLGKEGWTPVSLSRILPVLQIKAVSPIQDGTGTLQGFFTAGVLLPQISLFLNELHFSYSGQVFIVERSGELIATSVASEASAIHEVNGQPARLAAVHSQDLLTRNISQELIQQFGSFINIQSSQQLSLTVNGQRQFVQITPYQDNYGLDWLVVTIIPEADFMARIHVQNAWTVLLCLGTLAATSALGILAARRITTPLERLSLAAHRIAENEFEPEVPVTGVGEVKQLSQVFRQMAEQLRLSLQLRTDYERQLKQQVIERTAELVHVKELREAIFNESTDAIFLVGLTPPTRILDCNQRAVEMFEANSKAELIGIQGSTLQKQPYTEDELDAIHDEVRQKGFWSREIEYVTKTGKTFWGNLAAKPISVAGEWMQLVRLTDISDRKQLELALQQSEAKTKDILDSAIAAIASMRVFKDGSWIIDQVSAGCEIISGYTVEALIRDQQLWTSCILPEDWDANAAQIFANIFAGKTHTYEYRLRQKNGHLRWISQTNNSAWNEEQQYWSVTAISTDITDRKEAELALQRSETILREAQRVAHLGSWEFDIETRTTYWSEELYRIYHCDLNQPPPTPEEFPIRLVHPDDRVVFQSFADQLAQGYPAEQDFRVVLSNGSIRYIAAKGEPIFDPNGTLVRLMGTAMNVTDRKLTEAKLRQTEQWLQQYSRQSPTISYTVVQEPDGQIWFEYITSAVEVIHEISQEQVLENAQLLFDQIHPDDVAGYLEATAHSAATLEMFSYEWRIITPSGKLRWEQANSQPERRSNGAIAWHGVVQDITDRKAIELALQHKTEELDRFFSVALDLLCIADTDGYFRRLNQQWEATLGYSLQELEGSRFLDYVHPDDIDSTLNEISLLANQGTSLNFVNRYQCRNGSYRWLEWRSFPVGDLIYAAARDITVRRQTELALRRSEQKFRGAFDTIMTGMALVSLAGGFQEVNQSLCEMLGYSTEELLALRLQDVVHPDDYPLGLSSMEQMMAGDIPGYQVEKRFLRQDGQPIWGLLNIALMHDTDDRPLYLIAQIVDISERHRLDGIKDEFISVVSHELRTPLTSIRGSLGILNAGVLSDEPETAQQMLHVALKSTDRLVRLVNDILDLERLESGKASLEKEACDVNDLMEQAVDSVQVLADQASVHLSWIPFAAQVEADNGAIVQTLTNLLSNAIKFSPAGGTVWLKATLWEWAGGQGSKGAKELPIPTSTHRSTYLLFSVTDQGRGIPPEKLDAIFGRFQQVDSSDSRQKGGTGLGLAICKTGNALDLLFLSCKSVEIEAVPQVIPSHGFRTRSLSSL